ncbi:MAG: hypothetical protein U1B30_10010 [Pseudomonadota bacterium]|nr:hypothetical protein [Pseudomonadota bacterium]
MIACLNYYSEIVRAPIEESEAYMLIAFSICKKKPVQFSPYKKSLLFIPPEVDIRNVANLRTNRANDAGKPDGFVLAGI